MRKREATWRGAERRVGREVRGGAKEGNVDEGMSLLVGWRDTFRLRASLLQ